MPRIAIVAVLCLFAVSLHAQWLDFRTPGIPRTADGKPNLKAPAPRTPDGKPDLSGIWQPETNPYRFDVIQDLKDESVFKPAAEAIFMARVKDFRRDDPVTNCLPGGPAEMINTTYRIIQTPTLVALLFESGTGRYRQIYMDGRRLPENPNPTWLGYSVGHWDGDTLVVETNNVRAGTIDRDGVPYSDKLTAVERIRRVSPTRLEIETTLTDPEAFVTPFTLKRAYVPMPPGSRFEEYLCENNRDL